MSKEKEGHLVYDHHPIAYLCEEITMFNSIQQKLLKAIAKTESCFENTQEIEDGQRADLSFALEKIKTLNNQIECHLQSLISPTPGDYR